MKSSGKLAPRSNAQFNKHTRGENWQEDMWTAGKIGTTGDKARKLFQLSGHRLPTVVKVKSRGCIWKLRGSLYVLTATYRWL